jgi:hypothetical protein
MSKPAGEQKRDGRTAQQCPRSSCFAAVIPQQAAETFPALGVAEGTPHLVPGHEDPIAHSLVIAFAVAMGKEFTNCIP